MKIVFFKSNIWLFAVFFSLFTGCDNLNVVKGNGNVISQSRVLNPFSSIRIVDNFQIMLEKSQREELLIEADENLIGLINTNVSNNELVIQTQENLKGSEPIKITIFYQQIDKIDVTGASLINNSDVLKADELDVELSGAGVIDLELETKNLNLELSGAGMITLRGFSNSQSLDLSGAGNMDVSQLISQKCKVKLSGFGSAIVHATESLNARVDGAGVIRYYGNPKQLEKRIEGLGNVIQVSEKENNQNQSDTK